MISAVIHGYKIKYPEHNLDRAKNQFKLLQSLSQKLSKI